MVDHWTNYNPSDRLLERIFHNLRDAGREDSLCCVLHPPKFPLHEEGQSRGAESPKGSSGPTREERSPS